MNNRYSDATIQMDNTNNEEAAAPVNDNNVNAIQQQQQQQQHGGSERDHRRNLSDSVGDWWNAMADAVTDVTEAVTDEFAVVQEALREELEFAAEGETIGTFSGAIAAAYEAAAADNEDGSFVVLKNIQETNSFVGSDIVTTTDDSAAAAPDGSYQQQPQEQKNPHHVRRRTGGGGSTASAAMARAAALGTRAGEKAALHHIRRRTGGSVASAAMARAAAAAAPGDAAVAIDHGHDDDHLELDTQTNASTNAAAPTKFFLLEMSMTRGMSLLPGDVVDAGTLQVDHNFLTTMAGTATIPETTTMTTSTRVTTEDLTEVETFHDASPESGISSAAARQQEIISPPTHQHLDNDEPLKLSKDEPSEPEATPLAAYILLASAVICLSAIGPLLDAQEGVNATLKITWRKGSTAIFLCPIAISAMIRNGVPRLSWMHFILLLLTAACYAAQCVFFAWSCENTTVGNATILANSQAMILLVGKLFIGDCITFPEAFGAIVAFSGAVLCSRDSADGAAADAATAAMGGGDDVVAPANNTFLGDFYGVMAAVTGVLYVSFAKTVRPHLDLSVFMFSVMTLGMLETIGFLAITGEQVTFDRNIEHGVWGWMNFRVDRLPLEIIMVLVCNMMGAIGYIRAMAYFSNLVILVAALMEPVTAEILAICMGIGTLPGWNGWMGNLLVILGTILVVYTPPESAPKRTTTTTTKNDHTTTTADETSKLLPFKEKP